MRRQKFKWIRDNLYCLWAKWLVANKNLGYNFQIWKKTRKNLKCYHHIFLIWNVWEWETMFKARVRLFQGGFDNLREMIQISCKLILPLWKFLLVVCVADICHELVEVPLELGLRLRHLLADKIYFKFRVNIIENQTFVIIDVINYLCFYLTNSKEWIKFEQD